MCVVIYLVFVYTTRFSFLKGMGALFVRILYHPLLFFKGMGALFVYISFYRPLLFFEGCAPFLFEFLVYLDIDGVAPESCKIPARSRDPRFFIHSSKIVDSAATVAPGATRSLRADAMRRTGATPSASERQNGYASQTDRAWRSRALQTYTHTQARTM